MNPFRQLLKASGGQPPLGTWILSASPVVAEAVGHAGFDWGVLDMEHAPAGVFDVLQMLQAVGNTKMVPVVRVPWNDAVAVKRVLDAGATTVMFPFVEDAEEAARAVAATRYPPLGVRGMVGMSRATRFGTQRDAIANANRTVGTLVQLESPQALERLEAIAAVPGVDALFIGPADLSARMGHVGEAGHPRVVEAMAAAARRSAQCGKPIGTVGGSARQVAQLRAAGFHFVALGSDLDLLMDAAGQGLRALRRQPGDGDDVHTLSHGTRIHAD